ncbi:MAG: hypothetical protein ACP5JO_09370 [Candidatus Ratteibacteria bacterium]
MLYTPSKTCGIWDTWCFYRNGIYHLFYLHRTDTNVISDGISLAVSNNGILREEIGDILVSLPEEPSLTRFIRYDIKNCDAGKEVPWKSGYLSGIAFLSCKFTTFLCGVI